VFFLLSFFGRQKRRLLLQKILSMNLLKKGPPQAPLLSVWIVGKKEIDSINLTAI
jgi:hypothetical protein